MIDLSTLKAGDFVKFRNGGVSNIGSIKNTSKNIHDHFPFEVMIGCFCGDYRSNGTFGRKGDDFDIIEIIKKPEEVSDIIKFLNSSDITYSERSFYASIAAAILKQAREEMK